ncbi:MAG: OmpA family protein, partial [Flavobacteriales bacterium]|nr:OmpA family protein [Flavobacteriales bacterium]
MKNLLVLFLFIASTVSAQQTVELSVHFDRGSDIPYKAEMVMLNEVAQYDNSDHLRFWVVGHTDDRGSENYNRKLSKTRTQTVVYHLLMSGIKPYNIIFEYYGEECPMRENDTRESRAENRRVEVRISNVGPLDEPGFAGRYPQKMFQRPLKNVNPDPEVFVFDNKHSECIETASGTQIDIPPMAFMDAYGRPVGGEVEVTYQEFTDPFGVFLSGINMKYDSDGQTHDLETAGMFNINATHRGKPVELRDGRPVHVDFVSVSKDNDFDFFFLDPATEAWKNLGNAAIEDEDAELIKIVENMSVAARNYMQQTDFLSAAIASRTTLESRFQNMEYMHNRPIASYYRFLRKGDQRESKQFRKEWKKQADFQIRVLPHRHGNDEKTIHFKIGKRIKNTFNPEWRGFSSRVWEYNGELNRSAVKNLIQRKRFHNLRV